MDWFETASVVVRLLYDCCMPRSQSKDEALPKYRRTCVEAAPKESRGCSLVYTRERGGDGGLVRISTDFDGFERTLF